MPLAVIRKAAIRGRGALFALGLLLFAATIAAAETSISIPQARALGLQLVQSGRADAAREIAKVLLTRDSNDYVAHLILAQAERTRGAYPEARQAAAQAWSLAKTDSEHYGAALVRAQVLSSAGARTRAQIWLRRAAEIAPNRAAHDRAVRDFRYVRSRNPVTTHLRFGISPSSNINNGSKSDVLVIDGLTYELSGDARALSGVEFSFGLTTELRKDISDTLRLRYGLSADTKTYALSNASKLQAPNQTGSDFAFSALELTFGIDTANLTNGHLWSYDFSAGKSWYSGQELAYYGRFRVSRSQNYQTGMRARYSFDLDQQWRLDNAQRSSTAATLRGDWSKQISETGYVSFGLGWRETISRSDPAEHTAVMARLSFDFDREIMGAKPSISLDLEARDYPGDVFGGLSREDLRARASVSFLFTDMSYLGFAPRLGLSYERNHSNLTIYDTEGFGLSLGIQSVF